MSTGALKLASVGPKRKAGAPPIEYSLLLTATLCLLAFGVVMVFSASSTTLLLGKSGDSAYYLKRTVLFGVAGLILMRFLSKHGLRAVSRMTPALLIGAIGLLFVVLLPGIGMEVNGAKRWIGTGFFQIQPSEIAKVALVLYGAYMLARRPKMVNSIGEMAPFLLGVGMVCLLVVAEPDLGTALVACFTAAALLTAAGARMRDLGLLFAVLGGVVLLAVLIEPYRMARLTGFIDPSADPGGAGFQAIQAKIALGSGGVFGVGLGESLQKAFYLPEAHTDMIAAVIGEELGLLGITVLVGLYGLFGYAGLRTAQRARDRYGKLLAAGLTSLVMVQATINLFAVLGLAPLTGVPLPFVSYGNSSMLVMLAAVGLLLNIAAGGTAGIKAVPQSSRTRASTRNGRVNADDGRRSRATSRNSGGRNSRPRRAGAGRRRRAAG
jgi:cell division protein FtsW